MNLFDLFVTIGVKDEVSDKVPAIGEKLKSGIAVAGKVAAASAVAATTAVVALGKQAVEGYAEYEQLVGGVETLFKTSSDTVQEYAANAYKTAGMSANEYMNTVTGFSASLLSSLGGDTDKAAEYANRAVLSMSDNANKMGTDITMIQNAYQGFAKQNYTMLDNLKLGYGGTQAEMQRLIADAAAMTDVQERLGITVDESSMSFDNIVNAIQVMQENMGIAGATAAEAEGTISGSVSAMKSAWENLVVGFADGNADIDLLLNNFLESVKIVGGNLLPVIQTVLTSLGNLLEEHGPEMIASGVMLLAKLAFGIVKAIPDVIAKVPEIISAIVEEFQENGPEFAEIGKEIVRGVWEGIKSLAGWLAEQVGNFFDGIVDGAKSALGIHSPSRVFAGIGENMALGVGEGWSNEYASVQRGIAGGLDFGTAKAKAFTTGSMNYYSAPNFGGEIVVEAPVYVGGAVVARNQYRFNLAEAQRRGPSLVNA